MIARFVAMQNWANDMHPRFEKIPHSGDRGHSNLRGVAECNLPWVFHCRFVGIFAAGHCCMVRAVASELGEIAGKTAEGGPETAGWSSLAFDLQKVSYTG